MTNRIILVVSLLVVGGLTGAFISESRHPSKAALHNKFVQTAAAGCIGGAGMVINGFQIPVTESLANTITFECANGAAQMVAQAEKEGKL